MVAFLKICVKVNRVIKKYSDCVKKNCRICYINEAQTSQSFWLECWRYDITSLHDDEIMLKQTNKQ